ncbi:hypothetical protein AC578_8295 [Pseudocercospora eumusae]|uniref:Uncharacterized protein n=1 Tax=Pseudocercospora eumusae TaxID=321146 RepID=A0A139GYT6_9PEZI|nr:hypothetical protein AC578_8295 [Pseudocercospora eumusae]KXS95366.1 hypothetical protein AC578_8295 [Pseudocercospora eumusae]
MQVRSAKIDRAHWQYKSGLRPLLRPVPSSFRHTNQHKQSNNLGHFQPLPTTPNTNSLLSYLTFFNLTSSNMSAENTPAPSAATEATAPTTQIIFTEKEVKNMAAAMATLIYNNGSPEFDMEYFMKVGSFGIRKTAQNQWGDLKKKMKEVQPGVTIVLPTQKQKKEAGSTTTTPKKRTKKEADGEEGGEGAEEGTPAKKARTPSKKTKKGSDSEEAEAEAGDGSPKSKKKASPVKKAAGKKGAATAKSEPAVKEEEPEKEDTPVKDAETKEGAEKEKAPEDEIKEEAAHGEE